MLIENEQFHQPTNLEESFFTAIFSKSWHGICKNETTETMHSLQSYNLIFNKMGT